MTHISSRSWMAVAVMFFAGLGILALGVEGKWLSRGEVQEDADPGRRVRALMSKSRALIDSGGHAEAEAVLKRALKVAAAEGRDADLVEIQKRLAELFKRQGKHRLAERVLRVSLRTQQLEGTPRAAHCPYTALGELYTALEERPKEADRQHAGVAIKRDQGAPTPPLVALAAALESFAGNHFADARRHLARAHVGGGDTRRQVLLGFILLLEKKYADAGARFRQVLKQSPRHAGARVGLGHLAVIRKDYVKARAHLQPSAVPSPAASPNGPVERSYNRLVWRMACLGAGWIAANQNRHKEAIQQFERVLSHNSDDLFALLGRGNSLNALGSLEQAEASLARVLNLDPSNKHAMAELALVKHNRGQDAQAERLFKAALKLDPGHYTCPHEGLGLIYLRAGKLGQAKLSFRKAIAINPNIEYRKFNGLARILIGEGDYAGARKLLRQSVKNYPFDHTARKLLSSIRGK